MTSGDFLELAIIVFILFGIAIAAWRGGAHNPVGTGGLERKFAALDNKLSGVEAKVGEIEQRLGKFEDAVASVAEIRRMEKAIERLAKAMPDLEGRLRAQAERQSEHAAMSAATAAKVDHIDRNLTLIMSVVVPKGMER